MRFDVDSCHSNSIIRLHLPHISYSASQDGRLAQLGEHRPYKARVTGSSPVASTIFCLVVLSSLFINFLKFVLPNLQQNTQMCGEYVPNMWHIRAATLPYPISLMACKTFCFERIFTGEFNEFLKLE